MDTILTSIEQNNLNHQKRLEEAKQQFEAQLKDKYKSEKRRPRNKKEKKIVNKKAKQYAKKVLESIDKGYLF